MATRAQQQRAAKQTPAERVAVSIRKGECDDQMDEVVNAIQARVMDGAVALRWRVQLDDLDVTEDQLLLDEAFLLEELLGVSWGAIEPLSSAKHASALLRVLYGRTCDDDEATAKVKALTVKEVMGAITRTTEVDPPKD